MVVDHNGFHSEGVLIPLEVIQEQIFLGGILTLVVIQEICIDLILDSPWTQEIPDLISELLWLIPEPGLLIRAMILACPENQEEEVHLAPCQLAVVYPTVIILGFLPNPQLEDPSLKESPTPSVMLISTTLRGTLRYQSPQQSRPLAVESIRTPCQSWQRSQQTRPG